MADVSSIEPPVLHSPGRRSGSSDGPKEAVPGITPTRRIAVGGESLAHRELKRRAMAWALGRRLPLLGCEVRVPHSPYRADLAATSRRPAGEAGLVALFECKQARSDFLRDEADEPEVRKEAEELTLRATALRALIAGHRPDLRRGEYLFPEFDEYDLRGLRHETLEKVERELAVRQNKILRSLKFARLHRYHAADHLYLVTFQGLIEPHEVPDGWGWLESTIDRDGLCLRCPPVRHPTTPAVRLAWLESIALAGARSHLRSLRLEPANQSPGEPPTQGIRAQESLCRG